VLALFSALALAGQRATAKPSPRSYDTHHYFSLETDPSASVESASRLASSLGAQLIERIGELDGHWLVRCDKDSAQNGNRKRDAERGYQDVIERWQGMKRKRSSEGGAIRDVRHLPVRKRSKRQFEAEAPSNQTWLPRDSMQELTYAQSSLSLADPLLPKQWHLINTVMPDVELNVTGLWGQEINGKGVKIAIIDDGLDMHSDDLAENFVSFIVI
jgi:kexin